MVGPVTNRAYEADLSLSTVRDFGTGQRTPIANNIAAMRRAIEAAGMLLLVGDKGDAAGIVRREVGGDGSSLIFDRTGDVAGKFRRARGKDRA